LLLAALGVAFGRAWQSLFLSVPVREWLWDEKLMTPWVAKIGFSWTDWASSIAVNNTIDQVQNGFGYLLFLTGFCMISWHFGLKKPLILRILGVLIVISTLWLFIIALSDYKSQFRHAGQFIESAMQLSALPLWWFIAVKDRSWASVAPYVWVVTALTFLGHATYAIGFYALPGHWVTIAVQLTGLDELSLRQVFKVAGWLDIMACLGLFFPQTRKISLIYMAIWGLVTALSRPVGLFSDVFVGDWARQYIHEGAFRLVHGLLPVVMLASDKLSHR
jgi:hypothetical protein